MDDTISRQAAIDLLKQMRKDGDMIPWEGKDVFARIRKLPPAQPEIIACGEGELFVSGADVGGMIDRQAAIEALRAMQTYKLFAGDDMLLIDQAGAQTELMMLPPAQPERIKGRWIKISPANIYECSECGKSVMTNDICAYDFCHGCGAGMEVTT